MSRRKKAALAGTGTASNTHDRPKFKQPDRIRLLPISNMVVAYPMPPALTDAEIVTSAAQLAAHHFTNPAEGAVHLDALERQGLPILLSWPDGVRVAISCQVTAAECIDIYRAARAHIEAGYREVVECHGGRA